MRKKIIMIMCAGIITMAVPVSGEVLTYNRCLSIALNQNLQVKISRNNAEIARRNAHIGNAGLLPRLDFSGGFEHQDSGSTTSAQIQASMTLFNGWENILRWRKLRASERSGRLESRGYIEKVLLEVSAAYFSAASAYEQQNIAQEMLNISKERLERAKNRSMYGQATTIDVLAAQVDFAADQVTWTQAQFAWDEARRNLNTFLNREIEIKFTVDTQVNFRRNFDIEYLKQSALQHNAQFLAASEQLNQSRLELKITEAAFYPQLDFTASYGLNQSIEGWGLNLSEAVETTRIGINLNLNLFNGFNHRTARTIAAIQLKNQQLILEETRLDLKKQVISAYESLKNSLLVLELEKKVVAAAELNFKRTRELYNLGQMTTTQFREAQINLIRSRSDLSSAKYQAKLNEIKLLQLTGGLSPENLTSSGI